MHNTLRIVFFQYIQIKPQIENTDSMLHCCMLRAPQWKLLKSILILVDNNNALKFKQFLNTNIRNKTKL